MTNNPTTPAAVPNSTPSVHLKPAAGGISDTPETDAEFKKQVLAYEQMREAGDPPFPAEFDFARKLERERNEALVVLEHFANGHVDISGTAVIIGYPKCEKIIAEARALLDSKRLAPSLRLNR